VYVDRKQLNATGPSQQKFKYRFEKITENKNVDTVFFSTTIGTAAVRNLLGGKELVDKFVI
jgi:hypothetical protein